MSTDVSTVSMQPTRPTGERHAIGGYRFDVLIALLTGWFIGGLFLDGRAHAHHLVDSFFTPWHAVLYSGYLVSAIGVTGAWLLNQRRGFSWREAIPDGYGLALIGAPLFIVAGAGDMIWHQLFGFEVGIEPLLSPTHLLLAASGLFMVSGPIRAAFRRQHVAGSEGWRALWPMLVSLMLMLSVFTFFTEFAYPFANISLVIVSRANSAKALGAAGILLQAGILMGFFLLALRRWKLPFGAFTFILTVNTFLMGFLIDRYMFLPVALVTGLVADVLVKVLQPSDERPASARVFAFVVPTLLYLLYFATLQIVATITWSIHLWLGVSILAGVVGLLLTYLWLPPRK